MIQSDEARAAIAAAKEALSNEPGLAWIKNSALVERAYFLGLGSGLGAIAADDDLNPIFVWIATRTMQGRSGDDTYPSTRIGQAYSMIESQLREGQSKSDSSTDDGASKLRDVVREIGRHLQHRVERIEHLLSEVSLGQPKPQESAPESTIREWEENESRRYAILQELEDHLRAVALLETDHSLSSRLSE